jgi:DNA-binding NarL/FixJ family response regulator
MPDSNSIAKKRILLVDDHPLLRQGIGQLVNRQPDLVICGEAEDRAAALALVQKVRPDLVVVDLSLKDDRGLELIKDLRVRLPELRTLVLSMHDESLYAERALRAGARGYIMKQEASEKVLEAIRCVLGGGVFVSKQIADSIVAGLAGRSGTPGTQSHGVLSDREMEILLLIGKGFGSQPIAKRLCISVKTVEAHRANIREKLKLGSGGELLQYAIRWARDQGEI